MFKITPFRLIALGILLLCSVRLPWLLILGAAWLFIDARRANPRPTRQAREAAAFDEKRFYERQAREDSMHERDLRLMQAQQSREAAEYKAEQVEVAARRAAYNAETQRVLRELSGASSGMDCYDSHLEAVTFGLWNRNAARAQMVLRQAA